MEGWFFTAESGQQSAVETEDEKYGIVVGNKWQQFLAPGPVEWPAAVRRKLLAAGGHPRLVAATHAELIIALPLPLHHWILS